MREDWRTTLPALSRVPPVLLILVAIASVQVGAAFAKGLFAALGPGGTVFLRAFIAALVLALVWRRSLFRLTRLDWPLVMLFGVVLGTMNLSFYYALERLPLGVAVTIEFIGPLSVALWGSRHIRDLVWIALAAAGILLLNPLSGQLDAIGMALAAIAGALWAAYIVLGARLGRRLPGNGGLTGAMIISAAVVAPFGAVPSLPVLHAPNLLFMAIGVSVLSSVLPYALEIEALRRIPQNLFGLLMSLEPVIAAIAGWAILGESLSPTQWLAIGAVMVASIGATRYGHTA